MKTTTRYTKFQPQQTIIAELEKNNPRFKRIFSEYETMSEELWNLETAEGPPIPDDFINAIKLQTSYLEDEIEDWLLHTEEHKD
ncbi:MAG: hypothetical protein Q4G16_11100 [Cruoricaptor ignavus]|nr:hypothetical protein [Cruoricaptor ignavus]